jgi:hypothetical protein
MNRALLKESTLVMRSLDADLELQPKLTNEFAIDRLNTHNSLDSGDLTILQSSKISNAKEKIDQEGISTSQNDL